jgi:hypothetical protein
MSLSESNHYYLQSMGIDLYVSRDALDTVDDKPAKLTTLEKIAAAKRLLEKSAPQRVASVKPILAEKPAFVMSLDTLTASKLIDDICLLLGTKSTDIEKLGNSHFRLGRLEWVFNKQDQEIKLVDNKLNCARLDTLLDVNNKKALWQCLTTFLA